MKVVTSLHRHRRTAGYRRQAARHVAARPAFYFDLASPHTYLAAERAEQMFAGLAWLPASSDALQCDVSLAEDERAAVAGRAAMLSLPLVWPVHPPLRVLGAMRVASLAAERGICAQFVLAASRLMYCGGYDIDDPEILSEAAAAAGIGFGDMLRAAGDVSRDGPIEAAGRRLLQAGADRLPALRVGGAVFGGENRMSEAFLALGRS